MVVRPVQGVLRTVPGAVTKHWVPKERKTEKRMTVNISGLPGDEPVFSHTNTVANVTWSLHERVLGSVVDGQWTATHLPSGPFATPAMERIQRRIIRRLPKHLIPITGDQFCQQYAGSKKKAYERALLSLNMHSVEEKDSCINCFLKPEKWRKLMAPRMISPRTPRYLLSVGRYISPVEHTVYSAIKRTMGHPVVMKGFTVEQRAETLDNHWNQFAEPTAVVLDASKFDQHCSVQALQYEHKFYRAMYSGDKELRRLLKWQLRNFCFAVTEDGKVRWIQKGGRMSGDMNTALGNCILTVAMVYGYAEEMGIRMRAMVDGDDCVVIIEKNDIPTFMSGLKAWYLKRGFRMKMDGPFRRKEDVEFCQCRYVKLASGPIFVRNWKKAVQQDHAWIVKGGITHGEVLTATGLGGLSIYGHLPILGAYYRMLAGGRKISDKVARRMDNRSSWLRWSEGLSGKYVPPTEEARLAFFETFGVHPSDQRAIEAVYLRHRLRPATAIDLLDHNHHHTDKPVWYTPHINNLPN